MTVETLGSDNPVEPQTESPFASPMHPNSPASRPDETTVQTTSQQQPATVSHLSPAVPSGLPASEFPRLGAPTPEPANPAPPHEPRPKRSVPPIFVSAFARLQSANRRWAKNSRWMSLKRVPLLLSVVTALLSAPIVLWLANTAAATEQARIWDHVKIEAVERNEAIIALKAGGPNVEDGRSWLVFPAEKRFEALGATDIEPPLFRMTEAAKTEPRESWFSQGDRSFYSYTRPIDGRIWAVSVVETNWWTGQQAKAARGIKRRAILAWIATAGFVGLLAHWITRPARRTLGERADFLADAAHEMRTPLSVIQASAGHALSRVRPSEEYVLSLAEIRSAAERASAGVTELLELARFDAGQAVPRLAPLRLDLVAEEIAVGTRVDGCEVIVEVGPSVLVEADLALLRQALDNLVRNAAARSTTVVLRSAIEGRDGVIRVIDNGPGFAKEQLPYVFERYRRGDGRGSLGLGLPIAASIVAAHGGRIDIDSPAKTRISSNEGSMGAEVTIRLPLSR
jgi:signal transduction histidine kinase